MISRKNLWASLVVIAIALGLAGCVHTALPEQEVSPAPVGAVKLPLKIAVINDPSIVVHEPMGFYESLNPALTNAVRDALAVHFDHVVAVEDLSSVDEAALIATPSIHGPFTSEALCLTVTLTESGKSERSAELSSTDHFHVDAPGANDYFGTDLGIAAVSMVAPPLYLLAFRTVERHDAERFNARFGPALTAMANDIAVQAASNNAIRALALGSK